MSAIQTDEHTDEAGQREDVRHLFCPNPHAQAIGSPAYCGHRRTRPSTGIVRVAHCLNDPSYCPICVAVYLWRGTTLCQECKPL